MSYYPSGEELERISNWPIEDYHPLMAYIKDIWSFPEFGFHQDEDIYFLSTAGWSGNESIISALMNNQMFWLVFWFQSRRGGHYIFAPQNLKTIEKMEEFRKKGEL